jgi:tRNA modification GTPase
LTAEYELQKLQREIADLQNRYSSKPLIIVANKADKLSSENRRILEDTFSQVPNNSSTDNQQPTTSLPDKRQPTTFLLISAKESTGVDALKTQLLSYVNTGALRNNETIVTNTRHYDSLIKALEEVQKVNHGLQTNLPSDLLAIDIRQALYHFGEITGQVTNDELLGNIFENFCIGK